MDFRVLKKLYPRKKNSLNKSFTIYRLRDIEVGQFVSQMVQMADSKIVYEGIEKKKILTLVFLYQI